MVELTELTVKAIEFAGINLINSLPVVKVMLIDEPIIPPDYLRQSSKIEMISFSDVLMN